MESNVRRQFIKQKPLFVIITTNYVLVDPGSFSIRYLVCVSSGSLSCRLPRKWKTCPYTLPAFGMSNGRTTSAKIAEHSTFQSFDKGQKCIGSKRSLQNTMSEKVFAH